MSFERDGEAYRRIRKRFSDAFSLDACLEKGQDLVDIAENYKTAIGYPVLLPLFPTDSNLAMPRLRTRNCRFDIIDVDPYGSPRQFIPAVLELLDDKSILLITSGEMHSMRFQPKDVMSHYGVQANEQLRSTRTFFRTDNILILGAWVIQKGLERSVGLLPVFVYDYYTGHSGVQRIGFFVRQKIAVSRKSSIRRQLVNDPILGVRLIRCCFLSNAADDPQVVWRFCDNDPIDRIEKSITNRLDLLINT